MIEFRCANCGNQLSSPAGTEKTQVSCPTCGHVQTVPASAGAAPGHSDAGGNPFAGPPGGAFASPAGAVEAPGLGDPANPYAAPVGYHGEPLLGGAAGSIVPTRIDLVDVYQRAWTIFWANWPLIVGACVVALAVYVAIGMVLGAPLIALMLVTGDPNTTALTRAPSATG